MHPLYHTCILYIHAYMLLPCCSVHVNYFSTVSDVILSMVMIDAQKEVCFGEENAEEAITSLKAVVVNLTQSSPACRIPSILLTLSFNNNGMNVCKCTCNHQFKYSPR